MLYVYVTWELKVVSGPTGDLRTDFGFSTRVVKSS